MIHSLPRGFLALVAVLTLARSFSAGQAPSTGPYTPSQAESGRAGYTRYCAGCHGPTLLGAGEAPALAGPAFLATWGNRPTSRLFELLKASMPPNAIGQLGDEAYVEIIAYILRVTMSSMRACEIRPLCNRVFRLESMYHSFSSRPALIAATSSGDTRWTRIWSSTKSRHSAAQLLGSSPSGQR